MARTTKADLEREKADLEQDKRNLQAEVEDLHARLEQQRRSRSTPPDPPHSQSETICPLSQSPPVQAAPKDQKLDPPPEFDGKTSEYAAFIAHCEFYFGDKP